MVVTRKVVSVQLTKEENEMLRTMQRYCGNMPSCEDCIFRTSNCKCLYVNLTDNLDKIGAEEYREETDDD